MTPPHPPDDLQRELTTTCHLLGELGVCSSEENGKALDLLGELKEVTQKKDLELRRYFRKYFKKKIAKKLCVCVCAYNLFKEEEEIAPVAEMGHWWLLFAESRQLWHLQGSSKAGRGGG